MEMPLGYRGRSVFFAEKLQHQIYCCKVLCQRIRSCLASSSAVEIRYMITLDIVHYKNSSMTLRTGEAKVCSDEAI